LLTILISRRIIRDLSSLLMAASLEDRHSHFALTLRAALLILCVWSIRFAMLWCSDNELTNSLLYLAILNYGFTNTQIYWFISWNSLYDRSYWKSKTDYKPVWTSFIQYTYVFTAHCTKTW